MTAKGRVRRLLWDAVVMGGLVAVAVAVAVVIGVVVRQDAALEMYASDARALAKQVEDLGGKPVVTPPPPEQGPQGERGERGLPGIGIRGPRGETGPRGRPPSAGELLAAATQAFNANPPPPGEDGSDGRDGVDGEDGADGTDGADGRDGVDGEQGPPGPPGPSCPDGWHQEAVTVLTPTGPRETTTCVEDEGAVQ